MKMNVNKILLLILIILSSCKKEETPTFIELNDYQLINVIKDSFPINDQDQANLFSLNQSIWKSDQTIIINSQEDLFEQVTQFDYQLNKNVDFENFFLVGILSNIDLEKETIEYVDKIFIQNESKKIKIQIISNQFGNNKNQPYYSISELHWFVLPKKFIAWEFNTEFKIENIKEQIDLSIIEGNYIGTLYIEEINNINGNRQLSNVALTAKKISSESPNVNYSLTFEQQLIDFDSELIIKFENKVFAEGTGLNAYGPKYDYNLHFSTYDNESKMIYTSFQDFDNEYWMYFTGTKIE